MHNGRLAINAIAYQRYAAGPGNYEITQACPPGSGPLHSPRAFVDMGSLCANIPEAEARRWEPH
eukprot:1728607-Lingulodinium_polyedra.AAC.1